MPEGRLRSPGTATRRRAFVAALGGVLTIVTPRTAGAGEDRAKTVRSFQGSAARTS
jgi:hypothetical protein